MKFKYIKIQNTCGYKEAYFDFTNRNGTINNLALLYGPNGCGKTTLLDIANISSSPKRFQGRDVSMLFRKMIHHLDYNPGYESYGDFLNTMRIESVLSDGQQDYKVILEIDPKNIDMAQQEEADPSKVGVILNELPNDQPYYAFYSNADNPSNMVKFQINAEVKDMFLDIAEAVYGYECSLEKEVEEYDSQLQEYVTFFTDLVITKRDDGESAPPVRVHFRRMSAGERKIATLLSELCSPAQKDRFDIYLIDNVEMHCYMERHTTMIDKLLEHFPEKQIIATTHSPVLVGLPGRIKPYLPQKHLFDVVNIKKESYQKMVSQ